MKRFANLLDEYYGAKEALDRYDAHHPLEVAQPFAEDPPLEEPQARSEDDPPAGGHAREVTGDNGGLWAGTSNQKGKLLAGIVVGLLLIAATLALVRMLTGDSEQSVAGPIAVDPDLELDDENFCTWRLGEQPAPLVSRDPLQFRVDARCNDPKEPDPKRDPGTTIYSVPNNDNASRSLGRVRDNVAVDPICFVPGGDPVSDGSDPPNSSPIWIKISKPAGFVPNVNLGGGYSRSQLESLGLQPC